MTPKQKMIWKIFFAAKKREIKGIPDTLKKIIPVLFSRMKKIVINFLFGGFLFVSVLAVPFFLTIIFQGVEISIFYNSSLARYFTRTLSVLWLILDILIWVVGIWVVRGYVEASVLYKIKASDKSQSQLP